VTDVQLFGAQRSLWVEVVHDANTTPMVHAWAALLDYLDFEVTLMAVLPHKSIEAVVAAVVAAAVVAAVAESQPSVQVLWAGE